MNDLPTPESSRVSAAAAEKLAIRSAQLLWDLSNAEAALDKLREENARLHGQLSDLSEFVSTPQEAGGAPLPDEEFSK